MKKNNGLVNVMAVNDKVQLNQDVKEDDDDMEHTGTIIWYYFESVGVQSKMVEPSVRGGPAPGVKLDSFQ